MYFSLRENMKCSARAAFFVGDSNSNLGGRLFANGPLSRYGRRTLDAVPGDCDETYVTISGRSGSVHEAAIKK